jgi:DNA-binding transcriptional ArsR family regulator
LAKYAKALGHPARIALLKILASKATCQCGDIVEELHLSQSMVSQHLKELKDGNVKKQMPHASDLKYRGEMVKTSAR